MTRPRTKEGALDARDKLKATARRLRAEHRAEIAERIPAAAALADWLRTRPDQHARADALTLIGGALADIDGLDMPLPDTPAEEADIATGFSGYRAALSAGPAPAPLSPVPATQGAKPAMLTITITKPDDVPVLFDTLRQMLAATMPAPFVYPADAPADVVTGPVTLRDHARAAAQATEADATQSAEQSKRGRGRPPKAASTEPTPPAAPVADEQAPAPGAVEADLQAGGVEVAPEPAPVVEEPPAEKLTFDALKVKVAAFAENAEKGGGARLRALLTEFGVARISELPEARWVEFAGRVAL